jgi:subtilase family protein
VSLGVSRRVQAGAAMGLAAACLALTASSAPASSVQSQEWWLRALHVTQAQQSASAHGVTVAVLDTGVDKDQADLRGAVVTGPDYSDSGRVPGGLLWGVHGTAMASLIAGRGHGSNHAAGIMGIAPDATVLSVRVTLESNDPLLADANIAASLPDAIARGIRYAVRHDATVIDLPLDTVTTPGAAGAGGNAAERAAVAYALAHGVVLIAPAGDDVDGTDPVNFPAAYRGVISVGAFNSTFTRAPFSSHQPYVTLTAAGEGVVAANGASGYAQVSSTTAASAVVAGIAALIRAQFPALTPAQVTRALTQSTVFQRPGGQRTGSGAGTVDAAGALAAAARMAEAVPTSGSSSPAVTPAAQAPTPPAVHASGGLGKTLLIDVGIAVAVFLLLAVPILGYGRYRRRRARAARLAEVRAAAQPVARPLSEASARAGARTQPKPRAQPKPRSKPKARAKPEARRTRKAATATAKPEEYSYIPAPVSPAPPAAGARPANGAGASAQPPWAPWGSGSGPPGSGFTGSSFTGSSFTGSAFPVSAFPRAGHGGAPAEPTAPAGRAAQGGPAAQSGPAGLAGAGGQAEEAARPFGKTGPAATTGPLFGEGSAHAGPAHAGPAQAGPARAGGILGARTPGGALGGPTPGGALGGPTPGGTLGRPAPEGPAPGRPTPGGTPGGPAPGGGPGAESGPAAPGTAAGRPMGPHRTGAPRTPKVSGSPPWEPAPEPVGEVPWGRPLMPPTIGARAFPMGSPQSPAAPVPEFPASGPPEPAGHGAPGPGRPGAPGPRAPGPGRPGAERPGPGGPGPESAQPEPDLSPWDAIAEEAWPGGPGASKPSAPTPRRQASGNGLPDQTHVSRSGPQDEDPSAASQPIYVWNPAASTDSFPAVPPDEENKP